MPARRLNNIIDAIDIMILPTKYIISVDITLLGAPYPLHLTGPEFDDIRKTKESFIQKLSGRVNVGLLKQDIEDLITYDYEKI
jgi:hypothetical protein